MTIEIKKRLMYDTTHRFYEGTRTPILKRYYLYVILINGKRVDAFLKYRNAQRKVRNIRRCLMNSSPTQKIS